MRYRIIEESDLNGKRHYEVEWWVHGLFSAGWRPEPCLGEDDRAQRFETAGSAQAYVNSKTKTRNIVKEGEICD